ncbi:MAG: TlpA disulfide reductase family protein, partial [Microterricola sp.]
MRARVYWPVTIAAALLVGLLAYGVTTTGTDTTLDSAMARGERVDPPTSESLPKLGGAGTGSLADYRGQGVLVNVWASWCSPCRDELPLIEKAHAMLSERGGTVLGIDV